MIICNNVTYEYPGKLALDNVSFAIKNGSITALVGPNGAGKSTLMRCIAALEKPFTGQISVAGFETINNPREVHKNIGYLSDFFGLYNTLTVKQCLTFMANIHRLDTKVIKDKVGLAAERLDLNAYMNKKAGTLSRGWRQRLGIAQAIIHEPKLLILDEPASGLDPEARQSLSNLFLGLQQQGMTLLVSSHILSELEDYCTDMLLIRDGKIVGHHEAEIQQQQNPAELLHITLATDPQQFTSKLQQFTHINNLRINNRNIECEFHGNETDLATLLKQLVTADIPVIGFNLRKRKLQDIYLEHSNNKLTVIITN